jgi:hypothetical protein
MPVDVAGRFELSEVPPGRYVAHALAGGPEELVQVTTCCGLSPRS